MNNSFDNHDDQPLILTLLIKRGALDTKKIETLRELQNKDSSPVEQILTQKNLVSDKDIAAPTPSI